MTKLIRLSISLTHCGWLVLSTWFGMIFSMAVIFPGHTTLAVWTNALPIRMVLDTGMGVLWSILWLRFVFFVVLIFFSISALSCSRQEVWRLRSSSSGVLTWWSWIFWHGLRGPCCNSEHPSRHWIMSLRMLSLHVFLKFIVTSHNFAFAIRERAFERHLNSISMALMHRVQVFHQFQSLRLLVAGVLWTLTTIPS